MARRFEVSLTVYCLKYLRAQARLIIGIIFFRPGHSDPRINRGFEGEGAVRIAHEYVADRASGGARSLASRPVHEHLKVRGVRKGSISVIRKANQHDQVSEGGGGRQQLPAIGVFRSSGAGRAADVVFAGTRRAKRAARGLLHLGPRREMLRHGPRRPHAERGLRTAVPHSRAHEIAGRGIHGRVHLAMIARVVDDGVPVLVFLPVVRFVPAQEEGREYVSALILFEERMGAC